MYVNSKVILLTHMLHMLCVSCCILLLVVLFPCFGLDDMDRYTIFFVSNDWSYTWLGNVYGMSVLVSLLLIVFAGSFHSLIYCVLFWVHNRSTSNAVVRKKGAYLTLVALLLIAVFPVLPLYFVNVNEDVLTFLPSYVCGFLIALNVLPPIYVLPYLFIKLIDPHLRQNRWYGIYRKIFFAQYALFFLLAAYWITPLPEVLKQFLDDKYLSPWY